MGFLQQIGDFDARVSNQLRLDTIAAPAPVVTAVKRFSQAGSYGIGWFVLFGAVLTWEEELRSGVIASGLVLATLLINTGVKQITKRPRPKPVVSDHAPTTSSMPSAHASMAAMGMVIMCITIPALAPLWWVLAFALGISRVMLGAHYLGDVIAGLMWGTVFGLAVAPLLLG